MSEGNWIPVTERLPEKGGFYDVKTNHDEGYAPYVLTADGRRQWLLPDSLTVIAWRERTNIQMHPNTL